ncbi:MAG: phosphatase PAP2 family protein [Clostridia bacterium]|nr:phosphatase PAP2 family protein [Clostridia bacterium]
MNKTFRLAAGLFAAFLMWTAAVCRIDLQPIGPQGSAVGLARLNGAFHRLTGVHMGLYTVTDWLGLVPLCLVFGFGMLGLVQWIGRKDIRRVDRSLLILGGFYVTVLAAFLFFERAVVNYRPVLIDGCLEASYPSSTTLLVMCVMPTAILQLDSRIRRPAVRQCLRLLLVGFMIFMVTARLLSGVHWLSDIIGGALLSAGLVMLYRGAVECRSIDRRK